MFSGFASTFTGPVHFESRCTLLQVISRQCGHCVMWISIPLSVVNGAMDTRQGSPVHQQTTAAA